ncbi:amidohydrolase family protein [Oryzihumus leptocrescens]|uniref:Imidazolonepropionase-like amidohydrolase n=1 Tax=Oryzihumus leptocrescens TaxID=297536 RepID=A0A542ZLD7_9MICO|nr:amidohydrolase family protein [Oryzihumus leptocrescens]TQL61164.1 imidazolonepropionase-like amidohydrolase [Oryzihumus leptocrescens]
MSAPVLHVRGQVLVGPEEVRDEVWVVDGRLSYVAPQAGTDVQTVSGWVLPGLVDAHCHVGLDAHGAVDEATSEAQALADREAGTLLIRDAGSPADTRWIDEREDLPRVIRAGRHIARTRRYIRNYAHEIEPEDLAAYVRQEARRGDGWVKLVGDWIDRESGDLAPCWPREALTAAIAAAHEEGARVTAHCFGEESLRDFAAAGTDCIEHATGLEPDTIDAFAAQGIAIVPTLVNIDTFPAIAASAEEKFPLYAKHLRDLHARRYETVAAAHDAGIPIYLGTDAGGSLPHGLVAAEAAELVRAGLPAERALEAATWGARRWLGRPGLEEGAGADLVVYAADPREDIGVLAHPTHVVLRGHVVA